jgi:spermidine/putrescine transport system permease protein
MARPVGYAYIALIGVFIYLPVAILVLFSLQEGRLPVPPFNGPSLKWYAAVFADKRLMAAMINSILVGLISSLVAVFIGFLAAYGTARFTLKFSKLQQLMLTAPLMVSYLIIGMGLLILFNAIGIPKSLLAVGIGHVVINMPLCFAILYSQFGDHNANIERAARDLGAKEWQVLALVTAPMMAPALFAGFFLSMTFSWDEFVISFLLSRFEVTLPVEIWTLLRSGLNPKTNAVGSIVFLVSVALVLLFELVLFRKKRPA